MRRFYQKVDLRSRGEMTSFLASHFRYPTMNSWNNATSYACNLKVDRLRLDHELVMKLFDLIRVPDFFDPINDMVREFGEDHHYAWQAGFNGRSGGYLVLYQSALESSGYKSYCTACGQQNCKSVAETGNVCGKCGQPARVDYAKQHMRIVTYTGRGTDDGEDFSDWEMCQLRDRVQLVQEFDRLADSIVQEAIYIANNFSLEEETFLVKQTRQVLVPTA
ncbi:MAG: hypothetical protein FWC62_04690 [Firmicutes bacterium]|nr:hypothetical protein [Bacillota bacterium]